MSKSSSIAPRDLRRAATLLDERAIVLWMKYKTYRYGQPWDTTQARRQYYELKRLARLLRGDR